MNVYAERVIAHYKNPKNKGKLKNCDSFGEYGSPICGDVIEFYIKVNDNKIVDIGWETLGCIAAIATASTLSEIAKGKTLEEARQWVK